MHKATTKGSKLPSKHNTKRTRALYRACIYNAEIRNIQFLFSFDDWVLWWVRHLGSDWQQLRGNHGGKYVMARRKDKGPYVAGNVKCILFEENCSERAENGTAKCGDNVGESNPRSRLSKQQVIAIFNSKGSASVIHKEYGISRCTINDIRKGRSWTHVTGNL